MSAVNAVNNFLELRPSRIGDMVADAIAMNQPLMIWGPPGVGKTSIVTQRAEALGLKCIVISLTLFDPVDLRGLPTVDPDTMTVKWLPLGELPTDGEGVLFFDEINTADPSVMAAAMRLILNGRLGEYVLPAGWRRIAAGNRVEDGASANRMPSALADRFAHVTMGVHTDDWIDWADRAGLPGIISAFIAFRPAQLHNFEPRATVNTTPRGWADVAKFIERYKGVSSDVAFAFVAGRVGAGAATELRAFTDLWMSLPDLEDVLVRGDFSSVSRMTSPGLKYAMTMALAERVALAPSPGFFANALAYTGKIGAEFGRLASMSAIRRNPSLASSTEYLRWATSPSARLVG